MPRFHSPSELALSIVLSASLVSAYSFTFTSEPKQCADLSIQISGSGKPPYNVLVIPYGPTPLANNVEVRTILSKSFSGDQSSLTFKLKYPTNSQFVLVVSDSSGFGTGGTSVAANVLSSSDSSCFNSSKSVSPEFPYNINPPNQVVQCSASRLWWDASRVQGTPNFQGVIPGGNSFSIPIGAITEVTDQGTGFQWIPTVREGTTLLLVAGDSRGFGTGGSDVFTVSAGVTPNSSCLTSTSPSSTAGPPAGGSYPTSASGGTTGGSSGSNTGAIVGGVMGGLAAIAVFVLLALYVIRRKTGTNSRKERPVSLLQDPDDNEPPSGYQPPPYLQPDPYLVTAPTIASSSAQESGLRNSALLSDSLASSGWRHSRVTSFTDRRSVSPELEVGILTPGSTGAMTNSRKSAMSRQLRAVNVIQHEDAGPSSSQEPGEPETIELPPAYTNIRKQEQAQQEVIES